MDASPKRGKSSKCYKNNNIKREFFCNSQSTEVIVGKSIFFLHEQEYNVFLGKFHDITKLQQWKC